MNASSVSYAEANQEKLIQASVMANIATPKPSRPCDDVVLDEGVRELRRRRG